MSFYIDRGEDILLSQLWDFKYLEDLDVFTLFCYGGLTATHQDLLNVIRELCEAYDALSPERIQQYNQSIHDKRFPTRINRRSADQIQRVEKPTRGPLNGFVYLIRYGRSNKYKIGMSANPANRIRSIQTSTPETLSLVHTIQTANMLDLEFHFHCKFQPLNIRGEWFELNDQAIAEFMNYEEVA